MALEGRYLAFINLYFQIALLRVKDCDCRNYTVKLLLVFEFIMNINFLTKLILFSYRYRLQYSFKFRLLMISLYIV